MNQTPQQISDKLAQQLQGGQFPAAAKLAKTAMKKFPKEAHFANVAGTALASSNKGREAVQYFLKAVKLDPSHEEYQNNLVHAYIVAGMHDKAWDLGQKLLPRRSDPSKLCHLLAFGAELRGNQTRVIEMASKGLETASGYREQLLLLRADAYEKQEHFDLSEADYKAILSTTPNHPDAIQKLVSMYLSAFMVERARALLKTPLAAAPDNPTLLMAEADILMATGELDRARTTLRRVRTLDPYSEAAIVRQAQVATAEERADLIEVAEKAMAAHAKGTDMWCRLAMAIGNLHFADKNYKAAGRYLAKGKEGLAYLHVHHPSRDQQEFDLVCTETPSGPAVLRPVPVGRPKAIFVLGQPRSGTTLTEMILSAHPDVASCGELEGISHAVRQQRDKGGAFDANLFADTYYERLPEHARDSVALVDKMPPNYRFLGEILHGIPGAKVVHIERDPREVALSMWRQHFKAEGMSFTNNLKHIALRANLYRRYMNHWRAEFGDQFLTVNYSDLVADVERYSKEMAAFCELEWVPEMMAPQKNKAQVRTASVTQVREGVHSKSVGGWRAMEDSLQEFLRNLDRTLWPELDL